LVTAPGQWIINKIVNAGFSTDDVTEYRFDTVGHPLDTKTFTVAPQATGEDDYAPPTTGETETIPGIGTVLKPAETRFVFKVLVESGSPATGVPPIIESYIMDPDGKATLIIEDLQVERGE
jgi:hypothetical protein